MEERDIPLAAFSEVKIFTHDDRLGSELVQDDFPDEILSGKAGKLFIEGDDEESLDIKLPDFPDFLVKGLDHLEFIFSQDFSWMRKEC